MNISTKAGDDGYTEIIGGERLPKDHPVIECLGVIDELDAFLGDAKAAIALGTETSGTIKIINDIQNDLVQLMGIVAGYPGRTGFCEDRLEGLIKELEQELSFNSKEPVFTSFAVPGANPGSAKLHIARTICRRAERRIVSLGEDKIEAIGPYINRLSDVLFLLAQKESFRT